MTFTRYLAPDVAEWMAAEVDQHHGGAIECVWDAAWDSSREMATSARLVFRGNNAEAPVCLTDHRCGSVHIHNHPRHAQPYPSESDIKVAMQLAAIGTGMLIVSHDMRQGVLVRPPILPPIEGKDHKVWSLALGQRRYFIGWNKRRTP